MRVKGKHTRSLGKHSLALILRECFASQKDVEEVEPWQWESIVRAHLIVQVMVRFLGLLALFFMCYEKHLLDAKTLGSHMVLLNGLASLGINLDFLRG